MIRSTGIQTPTSGTSVEIGLSGGVGVVQVYKRNAPPAYVSLVIEGAPVRINLGSGSAVGIGKVPANGKLDVNGAVYAPSARLSGSVTVGTTYAGTGLVCLPNNTGIFWRNAANNNDLGLGVDGNDRLAFHVDSDMSGYGITALGTAVGTAFSTGTSPSATGNIRLGHSATIKMRNNANNADLALFSSNASDQLVVGVATTTFSGGAVLAGNVSLDTHVAVGVSPAQSGAVRLANSQFVSARKQDGSGDLTVIGMGASNTVLLGDYSGNTNRIVIYGSALGFYGAAAGAKPTITGSRGANAALASLLTALATLGLLTDSSS